VDAITRRAKPVLRAHLKPGAASAAALDRRRVLAFAGIGDPQRFFRTLRGCGIQLAGERAFPDHHPFSAAEIAALITDADRDNAALVTTEKDLVRLRGNEFPDRARDIVAFTVALEFEDEPALRKFVANRLFQARQKKFRPDA
jgi:tetraacyldisaccharide 4'-kinase